MLRIAIICLVLALAAPLLGFGLKAGFSGVDAIVLVAAFLTLAALSFRASRWKERPLQE